MKPIPLDGIKRAWISFVQQEPRKRQTLINEFSRSQPFIYEFVTGQDKYWFPEGPPKVRTLGLFVWLVFIAASQGRVPTVSREQVAALLGEKLIQWDALDNESLMRAAAEVHRDMSRHPQVDLLRFLMEYLTHREDCFELIPQDTKGTFFSLDIVIRSIDAVAASPDRS